MLRASPVRLPVLAMLPAITLTLTCIGATSAGAAGGIARHHGGAHAPVAAYRPHTAPVRPVYSASHIPHRRIGHHDGRVQRTRFYPGDFGYPYAYAAPGTHAAPGPAYAPEPAPRPPGPVSFADLPASTGIRPAPVSQPLFIRIDGRQVVADDGERRLWRAGPRIIGLDGAGARRVARQPGHAHAAMQGAPKIIVVRP